MKQTLLFFFFLLFTATATSSQLRSDIHFVLQPLRKGVYPHDKLCFRYYDLNNNLTDLHLETDEPPGHTKQVLSISITDNYGNILLSRENIPESHTKISFIPLLDSIVDVCLRNSLKDFSWAYKRCAREISLRLHQRGSEPRASPTAIKDQKLKLQSLTNSLGKIAVRNLKATQKAWEETKLLEAEKRDFNEASYEWLAYNLISLAIASFVFNAGVFAILRKFLREW